MLFRILSLAALTLAAGGCAEKTRTFSSEVQLARIDVVHRGDGGRVLTLDVEVEWTTCPGEQREVVRGDAAFAACIEKHAVGEKLPVTVDWQREPNGRYDWDILEIAGCKRTPEGHDDSSFEMVQECETLKEHEEAVGFRCNRVAKKELLAKCPWFRRN